MPIPATRAIPVMTPMADTQSPRRLQFIEKFPDRLRRDAHLHTSVCIDGEFKGYSIRGGLENSNENQSMSYDCCGFARNACIDGRLRSKSIRLRTGYGHGNSARRCPS
jgi:hypothetical protein